MIIESNHWRSKIMWQDQEEISRMTKPCRNNSPSYEHWLVTGIRRAVLSGGRVQWVRISAGRPAEERKGKERECPFWQVLKMIQGGSLNKRVSPTANRAFFIFSLWGGREFGKRQAIFPDPSVPLSVTVQREPSCPQCTHIRTKSLPSSHQEYKGQNLRIWKQGLIHC